MFRRPLDAAAFGDAIPVEIDGTTHLFYLSSPSGPLEYPGRVRTTWQHATSRDLVTWEHHPPAVVPGAPGAVDAGGIWTGSVVRHDGTYYLFYTGHDPESANPQTICLATSDDGITFAKHPGNPVLAPVAECEPVDWRDPFVFYNETEKRWWMLIAARAAEGPYWRRGVIMLATSPDLASWTVEPEPLYAPGTTYCPECPELWPLGDWWYLVYSRFDDDAGTVYRVADSPRGPFRTPKHEALGGRRWYAAKSARTDGGRVFFGWLHDHVDDRWLWGGDLATPRLVTADNDGSLRVSPVRNCWRIDEPHTVWTGGHGGAGRTDGHTVVPRLGEREHAVVEATLRDARAAEVRLQAAGGHGWALVVDPVACRVSLRRRPAQLDDFWADLTGRAESRRDVDGQTLASARTGGEYGVRFEVLVDGDILEVFIDDLSAITWRIDRAQPLSLEVAAEDGVVEWDVRVATWTPRE
jgi:beta-fructofuranosidase